MRYCACIAPFRVARDPSVKGLFGIALRGEWAVAPAKQPKTDIGWDVYAPAFTTVLKRLHRVTGNIPIEITENGVAYNTSPSHDGRVRDREWIAYLDSHLTRFPTRFRPVFRSAAYRVQ